MTIVFLRSIKLVILFTFCLTWTFLSGCASFPDDKNGGVIWQSSPRTPVWVSHQIETSPGLLFFVAKGFSGQSKKTAFMKAQIAAYGKIWEWFAHKGVRVLPEERHAYEARWSGQSSWSSKSVFSLEKCRQPLSPTVCDAWFVQRVSHPERREAWVLVSVERPLLGMLMESFLKQDEDRLKKMLLRDRMIDHQLSVGEALPAILGLERNQSSSSLFHSQTRLPSAERDALERLDQKTFGEIWTIRRSLTLSPYKIPHSSFIVPVGKFIKVPYRWKLFFRMHGNVFLVKGVSLDLFLDPARQFPDFPFLFLFPPSGFTEKEVVWPYQGLFLSADLALLEKIRRSPWIDKKCGMTDSGGIANCTLKKILILRHQGKICVRPFPERGHPMPKVFRGLTSCLPVSFYHRRELHGFSLKIAVDPKLDSVFLKKLVEMLKSKGFLIQSGGRNRYSGSIRVISVNRKSVGGATLYSESLLFRARLVDQNGVVRWGRTMATRGFGFSGKDAERDAVDRMVGRVVRSMDQTVRIYHDPIASSFLGRLIPIRNALVSWVINR
jgi:hypothetical protein